MSETERLRTAVAGIRDELSWYAAAGGAVSYDEMHEMIRRSLRHVDAVADLIAGERVLGWKPDKEPDTPV